ncbi:hypothetical protein ADUPG1_014190, partial [Aduncisulcus paluster]
ERKTIQKLYSF